MKSGLLHLMISIVLGLIILAFFNLSFSMALLPEPTIWIDGKLCLQGDKRVAVPDTSLGRGPAPSREDRIRVIWGALKRAKFRPVNGFTVPIDTVNPLRAILKGQVLIKVGDHWGSQVQELYIERDNAESTTWNVDVELLRKQGKSLPTKGL